MKRRDCIVLAAAGQDTGSIIIANTPDQFARQIKAEFEVYRKVVDSARLRLD